MYDKRTVTLQEIQALFEGALQDFYTRDSVLLEYDTEEAAVAERCMVFRIGWYMLNRMQTLPTLSQADLDCEYNRNFDHPKSMYRHTLEGITSKIKDAVPDLLIHGRRSNENNLLVIEFKKGAPSAESVLVDEEKLMYFTDSAKEYRYDWGLYVELHKHSVGIRVYQNGQHKSHLDYTFHPTMAR